MLFERKKSVAVVVDDDDDAKTLALLLLRFREVEVEEEEEEEVIVIIVFFVVLNAFVLNTEERDVDGVELEVSEESDRLERFAEAHLVAEDRAARGTCAAVII